MFNCLSKKYILGIAAVAAILSLGTTNARADTSHGDCACIITNIPVPYEVLYTNVTPRQCGRIAASFSPLDVNFLVHPGDQPGANGYCFLH
jgi:hypothetical protein